MTKYIDKSALVAEIERRIEKCDIFCIVAENNKDAMEEIKREIQHYKSLLDFLDTLEVKDANEALRTEYEKGRADVIAKACQFLHDYQEYPDHDIATDKLVEAFKMYIEL